MKIKFGLLFVYLFWLVVIILSIVCPFVCTFPLFWKICVGLLGVFNLVGIIANLKMMISSLKGE